MFNLKDSANKKQELDRKRTGSCSELKRVLDEDTFEGHTQSRLLKSGLLIASLATPSFLGCRLPTSLEQVKTG